jgi:hypothetical protein
MGMVATFRRLPETDLKRLRKNPELVVDYLAEAEPPAEFGPFTDLDVDKAWHAIHFLLTGSAWEGEPPLNFIASGGTEIGDDVGYGPARFLSAADVMRLATALKALPREELMQRFDAKALGAAEIYPEIWDRPAKEDDTRRYVANYYETLRAFVLDAATANEALLVSMV